MVVSSSEFEFLFNHRLSRESPRDTMIPGAACEDRSLHFLFFYCVSLTADGPQCAITRLPGTLPIPPKYGTATLSSPACGYEGSFYFSPAFALHFFYRDASSALLQQLVNQSMVEFYVLTFSRFPLRKKKRTQLALVIV